MQVSLAFTGTHSTGKSTLSKAIAERYGANVYQISGIMRTLITEGFPAGDETSIETLKAYVVRQFEAEDKAVLVPCPIVISERILIDGLAYVQANLERGKPPEAWSDLDLKHFTAVARRQCLWYDCLVYFPAEFPIVADKVRSIDEGYRLMVDKHLRAIIASIGRPVLHVSGPPERRIEQIEQWLWTHGVKLPHVS